MQRSRSDALLLVDCLQIAIAMASLVDLALPWWRYFDGQAGRTVTGWGALGDSTYGHGWGLIGAVVLTGGAAALRKRWAAITASLLAVLGAAIILIGGANLQSGGYDDSHGRPGLWVGAVLALLAAGGQAFAAAALRDGRRP